MFLSYAGFFQRDVRRGDQRHLIFATTEQLKLLAKCRRWYIDGTFKVIAKPFVQLVSIHGFLKKDDMMKQVIVMSLHSVLLSAILYTVPLLSTILNII